MECTEKVLNFGAGPSKIPKEVVKQIQEELICWGSTKMCIMEMSPQSEEIYRMNNQAQKSFRKLLDIPDNYKVLFLQGGATAMLSAVPLNLINNTGSADYIVTGNWSKRAAEEAIKYGHVNLVLPKNYNCLDIPDPNTWKLDRNASYVFYCDNETIDGIEFPYIPETNGVPLVADMSSSIMTKQLDIKKFGMIFGSAQKNIGTSGITFVIIRDDLLGNAMSICPTVFNLTHIAEENSLHLTPAIFPLYIMDCLLQWTVQNGGVAEMERLVTIKSKVLYSIIDESNGFYYCPIKPTVRSKVNIRFTVRTLNSKENIEEKFIKEAEKRNIFQLRGHRIVGGIRISLYNSVTLGDVKILANFMKQFYEQNCLL